MLIDDDHMGMVTTRAVARGAMAMTTEGCSKGG